MEWKHLLSFLPPHCICVCIFVNTLLQIGSRALAHPERIHQSVCSCTPLWWKLFVPGTKTTSYLPSGGERWPTLIAVSGSRTPGMSTLSDPRQLNFGGFGNWLKANYQFWSYHIRYRVSHIWHSYCAGHILRRCCYRYFFQRVNCQMPRDFNSFWRSIALLRPTLNEGEKNQLLPALLQVQSHNFPIQEEGLKTLQWDLFWSANQGLWRSPPDSTKQPKFLSIYNGKAPIMRWGWLSNVTFIGISTSAFLSYYRWRGYVDENQNLSSNEKHIPVPSSKRVIEVLIAILNTNFDKVFSVKLKR